MSITRSSGCSRHFDCKGTNHQNDQQRLDMLCYQIEGVAMATISSWVLNSQEGITWLPKLLHLGFQLVRVAL